MARTAKGALVVGLLCILLGLALKSCDSPCGVSRSRRHGALALKEVLGAAAQFKIETDRCPTSILELVSGGWLKAEPILWQRPLRLICTEGILEVRSTGPDAKWGTEDDMVTNDDPVPSPTVDGSAAGG